MSVRKISELPAVTQTPAGTFVFAVEDGELVKIPAAEGIAAQGLLQTVKPFAGNNIPLEKGIAWYEKTDPVNALFSPVIPPVPGHSRLSIFHLILTLSAGGTVIWSPEVAWIGGEAPVLEDGKTYSVSFASLDGVNWTANLSIPFGG